MSVKRYSLTFSGALVVSQDGGMVDYEDYAALEAKCAALAAENVTLNDKMNKLATWPGIEFYSSSWEFCNLDGNDALEFMCDIKTPATNAFLAEVRARGVEMFADVTIKIGEEEADEDIVYAGKQALLFAAQLRKGGA